MSNTKQLFESIQSYLNEAVFEIDYAGDGDLSTEEAIINNVKEWLGDLSDKVKIEVKEVKGPGAGWPEVRLIGDKELIGTFLNKEYNSGEDSLEDTYDLYLLKESDEVPYCDDVNCEPIKEDRFPSTDFIKRDWEKLQKDPMINAKEHWSDAYYQEVIDFGKELNKEEEHKHTREEIKGLLDMGAIDDPNYYNGLSDEEKEKLIDYWTEHYDDDLKEAEEQVTEEQPQEEVQPEEPVNDFEQLSPKIQEALNDISKNPMYKWVIDDVMDSMIDYDGDNMDEKLKSRLTEIMDHGCQSGTVGSLIYYTDTVKFFDNFNDEIYDMIDDMFGAQSVLEMLQQKCDLTDIIMGADTVKNYLAWMAYETVCSDILDVIESM